MKELPKSITVNGRRWRLIWLPRGHPLLDDGIGRVEAPDTKGKRMFIAMGQTPSDLHDTLLHEIAHASGWNLSEEWVATFAEDVTRIMKRLGYKFISIK